MIVIPSMSPFQAPAALILLEMSDHAYTLFQYHAQMPQNPLAPVP